MDNHHSSPRRPLAAAGTDHFLLGIGAAVTLDYAPSHEHWPMILQDSGRTADSRGAGCLHANRTTLQTSNLAVPHDSRARKSVSHFGHRIDCTGAAIRRIPSPATTVDTDLERSPLRPVGHEGRCVFDRMPLTRGPQMMDVDPQPVAARPTIPLITIGLPTPPSSDSSMRDYHCRPSPLSDNGSSPRLPSACTMPKTGAGLKQLCDMSPQACGHAYPCTGFTGSRCEMPISPVESVGTLSTHSESANFYSTALNAVPERGASTHRQTSSVGSGDSGYGSAASTAFLGSTNPRSRFLRVPSPLHSKPGGQPLTVPAPSVSTVSTQESSGEASRPQPSGPSSVFVCRLEGCFDRKRCFFLDVENRNKHERLEHGLDCQSNMQKSARTQRIGMGSSHHFETCNQDTIISSQAQQSVANHQRSRSSNDAGNGPKVFVTSRSQEPSPTEETRVNADNSLEASAPLRQLGTEHTLPQNPANTKDDTSASPGSSDQASQSTSSTSPTLLPDVELPSPMPKPKIDEMIDKLMDEFESMFDYYLGFDIHDESVDMSDTPDSDSEESDADDGAGPAMLITSPASQRSGASSTSPSSQSSILGSRAKCHTVAGEPGSAAGSSKAAAKAPARGSSKASSALGKRKIQDSGRPEDEDDDGNGERRKRQKDSEEESKGLRFACPYFQRHRSSNQGGPKMHASCMYPGFKTVARLKEHLYRCHMQPAHCVRCCRVFTTQPELNSHHLAAERCQDIPEKRIIDGITGDQERQIRSRRAKEGVNTEEDKWRDVYFILFPNDREAPSPYCVSNQATALSPGSVMFQNFERYSRREFPRLVRAELEVAALREEALMQERLRSVMVDAARRAAETLWEEFRNNNVQANGSNGEASQHVESSLPGPDVDFLAAPPLQPAAIPDARTVMAEEGRRYSTQGNGPSTDTSGSDSAYGTLLSGSNLAYSAARFPVASRGGAQEQSSLERVSLRTNAVVGGPSLSEHSDHSLDGTSIVPTQFESGPVGPHPHQQQQHQPYVWSSWDPGFRPEDWNLFNEQNMTTGAYLDDPSLQAPLPGDPRMGGDPTDSNG